METHLWSRSHLHTVKIWKLYAKTQREGTNSELKQKCAESINFSLVCQSSFCVLLPIIKINLRKGSAEQSKRVKLHLPEKQLFNPSPWPDFWQQEKKLMKADIPSILKGRGSFLFLCCVANRRTWEKGSLCASLGPNHSGDTGMEVPAPSHHPGRAASPKTTPFFWCFLVRSCSLLYPADRSLCMPGSIGQGSRSKFMHPVTAPWPSSGSDATRTAPGHQNIPLL